MSVFHVAAGSILVTTGLLLASVIIAAEGTEPAPTAQMNRSSYVERSTPIPTAQMNRGLYVRIDSGDTPYVPVHAANHPAPRRPAFAVTRPRLQGLTERRPAPLRGQCSAVGGAARSRLGRRLMGLDAEGNESLPEPRCGITVDPAFSSG